MIGLAVFAGAGPARAQSDEGAASAGLLSAIEAGRPIFELRPRFESAEQDGLADAEALTLRTRLGWKTGAWNGLSGLIEFDDVRALGGEYNDAVPPAEPFAVIADPEVTELNRLQLAWSPHDAFAATLGRQIIAFDDERFVGAVGWRQDDQTFDAVRLDLKHGGFAASYAYLDHVNRIFAEDLDWDSRSHLLNASYALGAPFKLAAFAYVIDLEDAGAALSNATYGVRASGQIALADVKLDYAASFAAQQDYGDNPNSYEADYVGLELGAAYGPFAARAGYESLEGEGAGRRFVTPLATGHKFQGWADVFLLTPNDGVEDAYAMGAVKPPLALPYLSKLALTAVWHDFAAERTGADLGDELDFIATASITQRLSVLVKYAHYDGTGAPPDTTRAWVGFEFKL